MALLVSRKATDCRILSNGSRGRLGPKAAVIATGSLAHHRSRRHTGAELSLKPGHCTSLFPSF